MEGDNNQFLLGEINATVKGTADDVKALRLDMGSIAQRVGHLETRLAEIETDRNAMKQFVQKADNHILSDTAWKAARDAETKTARRHLYGATIGAGAIASLGTMLIRAFVGI